jgi:3-phosphoshikimate 1-carboxyvinyltransferase
LTSSGASTDPLAIAPLGRPIDASLRVPGSKSLSNRHLVLAALRALDGRETTLRGALRCDDTERLATALARLGLALDFSGDDLRIRPGAPASAREAIEVNLGDGGTPTRFMLAFAAGALPESAGAVVVDGSARMRERPVAEGVAMLRALGAEIAFVEAEGRLPVRVRAGSMHGGAIKVGRTASSQFVSALLLVAHRLRDGLDLAFTEHPTSASYIELSLAALGQAGLGGGLRVDRAPDGALARIRIEASSSSGTSPSSRSGAPTVSIEPDASSAVYPAAAAVLVGGRVVLEGLPRDSVQPDRAFLDDLARRGARVEPCRATDGGPATLVAADGALRGVDSDYALAPDAAVMAMVLAGAGDRPSRFTGLGTLRVKESDRIEAVAAGLRALGGTVETGPDWVRVDPLPADLRPAAIDTVNDHRIAMAFAVLGLARPGVSIRNPACVAKSWPGFWRSIDLLRARAIGDTAASTP